MVYFKALSINVHAMKNTLWWIVIVIVVLAIIGFFWYEHSSSISMSAPAAEQEANVLNATATPTATVAGRDNSDASLNADLSDINTQMTGLNADSAAAQ
jgi:hypothetical protein